jgi:hypothetical protein
MALKNDLQALLTVSDKIKTDVNKLEELKGLLSVVEGKADNFDIYWRGVNDVEYRYNITKDALISLLQGEITYTDTELTKNDAEALLAAEITKLGGK